MRTGEPRLLLTHSLKPLPAVGVEPSSGSAPRAHCRPYVVGLSSGRVRHALISGSVLGLSAPVAAPARVATAAAGVVV